MKIKTLLTLVAIIISSNAVSKESKTDDVLELNNETVLLKLNDGSKVLVKTCDEYVTLRKAGKKIVGYPGRDPQELGEATRNLDECFMKAYATAKGWKDVSATTQPASIKDIVEHFPAELAMKTSRTSGTKAKTISDTATDWSMTDNGAYISKANRVGYFPLPPIIMSIKKALCIYSSHWRILITQRMFGTLQATRLYLKTLRFGSLIK
ncbi:hypothetical protein [Rahnella perminowiae]|uniref:hypothetical protein n=1 Tax=Rahnella perminowiae TaxID=2816244 RepID=UPI00215C7ABB|nr:hypothetical protein [Rahnella perminowiae]MCR8998631.1 hypothetical protein [Rahnella perminowiae]